MSTATQTPTGAALDALMARVRFQPSWGYTYKQCPHCGSDKLLSVMREANRTHRPWMSCDGCGARLGWSQDIDAAIRKQLIAIGAPIRERAAA